MDDMIWQNYVLEYSDNSEIEKAGPKPQGKE